LEHCQYQEIAAHHAVPFKHTDAAPCIVLFEVAARFQVCRPVAPPSKIASISFFDFICVTCFGEWPEVCWQASTDIFKICFPGNVALATFRKEKAGSLPTSQNFLRIGRRNL
jgi:hypothetical protein